MFFWRENMEYLSANDISKIWQISKRRVQILCSEGRIEGVIRVGNMYLIPKSASKPKDQRKKQKIGG